MSRIEQIKAEQKKLADEPTPTQLLQVVFPRHHKQHD
jgi:hypothetical protein